MQDCRIGTYLAMWFAASIPITYIWHYSPCYPSPTPYPSLYLLQAPPNRPQCVMLPSLCPCVLIVQLPPMSENMWYLIFCSCVSLLRMLLTDSSMFLQRTQTHHFLWLHRIPWYMCATFSLSSLSLMGIWVGSKSLLL